MSTTVWRWALAIVLIAGCSDAPTASPDSGAGHDAGAGTDAPDIDAGPPGCRSDAECDDHVDCTADTCVVGPGSCRHTITPALCAPGESCNPMTGCMPGRPCATSADCADTDACTTMETCDPHARVCTFVPLDGDADGNAPRVCGGTDCDDSDPMIYAGASERCNTFDDDCDGRTDEGLETSICSFCGTVNACHDEDMSACYLRIEAALTTLACGNRDAIATAIGVCASESCSTYRTCEASAGAMCMCPTGRGLCGGLFGSCADTTTDITNCGSCGNACPFGTSCIASACVCPGGLALCGGGCTDTTSDFGNCGTCAHVCPSGSTCTGSTCVCPTGQTGCGVSATSIGWCTDTSTDNANCGSCGHACMGTDVCSGGTCVGCGHRDDPCCSGGGCDVGLYCASDVPNGLCVQNDSCWFPRPAGSCSAGQSCFVAVDGALAFCAAPTGSVVLGGACHRYTDCANGLTCHDGRCERVCDPLDTCPNGGGCNSSSDFSVCCGAYGDPCCWYSSGPSCIAPGSVCNAATTACECASGYSACGGACAYTDYDPLNCGSCGHACAAGQDCVGGTCRACGLVGNACCVSGTACGTGLLCAGTTCRREAACDVFAQTGCGAGEGCYSYAGNTYCAPPGVASTGATCIVDTDCARGLGCTQMGRSFVCSPYCNALCTAGSTCMSGQYCSSSWGAAIGTCVPGIAPAPDSGPGPVPDAGC